TCPNSTSAVFPIVSKTLLLIPMSGSSFDSHKIVAALRAMPLQPCFQCDRIVPALVAGRVKQGDRTLAQVAAQLPHGRFRRRILELGGIGGAERAPVLR